MTTQELIGILKQKGLKNLYHVNTVVTSLTFINNNGLFSRMAIENKGLMQTSQETDSSDKKLGIYNDIFFDSVDIHSRAKTLNFYGPVTFVFNIEVLNNFNIDNIKITRSNPKYWSEEMSDEERYIQNIIKDFQVGDFAQEITIRNQSKPLSFEYLDYILLENPKIKKTEYFDNAYSTLNEAIKKSDIKAPLNIRQCPEECKCIEKYNSAKEGYTFHRFKTYQ